MSDQPTRDESAIPFSERVTIDTLADRSSIPSFDARPEEWKPETGLRIEFKAKTTDRLMDSLREEMAPGGRYVSSEPELRGCVAIFGPQNSDGGRPMAIFDKGLGRIIQSPEETISSYRIAAPSLDKPINEFTILREGQSAAIALHTDNEREDWAGASEIMIESIKTGPIS